MKKITQHLMQMGPTGGGVSVFLVLALVSALVLSGISRAQSTGNGDVIQSGLRHDAWRMTPKALLPLPGDAQRREALTDRANYFDRTSVSGVPLDQPQPPPNGGSSGSFMAENEIPFFHNEAIIVARFNDYQPYLTPSRLSIYTDIKLSVEQVLEAGPTGISAGQTIDFLINGGTVLLPDGRTISDHAYDPRGDFSLQPGHRYVLFLQYESKGDFFTDHKDWELINGVSVPNRPDELTRAQEGRSNYSGLSESAFVEAVQKAILQHEQGR